MHLSIIVPLYQESKNLERFLMRMAKQTAKNYEIIFVVDTSSNNALVLIDRFLTLHQQVKIKLIYNSRRQGRSSAIKKASQIATGHYSIIVSTSDIFKDNFVDQINAITSEVQADIIEFCARSHNPIWFQGLPRKIIKLFDEDFTRQKRNLFAYLYPFVFNKIIKTSILQKVSRYPQINSQMVNSRFSIEIIFKCLLFAQSYYSLNEKIVRSKKSKGTNYNPISILKEWNKLIKSEIFHHYREELEYNRYFSWKIIYKPYNHYFKRSNSQIKFENFFVKNISDSFYDSNTYYLKNDKEANLLKEYKEKNSYRAYKEL